MERYSYSRLETFKQCPRKYAFQYIEKPDVEKRQSIEAFVGSMCHEAIQQVYKDLLVSKKMSLEETLALYDFLWEENRPETLRIVRERYTEDNYRDTGRGYVRDFYKKKKPFADGKTVGIEKQVSLTLGLEGYHLVGYIDRLVDHGKGRLEIIDYKTEKELPSQQSLEEKWQLPLYQIALLQMYPDVKEVTCTWYFLAHNKELSVSKSPLELEIIKDNVVTLIDEINKTQEFEPHASALCSWCDYEPMCPARKHLLEVAQLPAAEQKLESGVQLVDEYLALSKEIAAAKMQRDEVEQKIYRYAQEKGVINVRGTKEKIRVWSKKGAIRLVAKDDNPSAHKEIMEILKRYKCEEQYITLATFGLSKAIENNQLPSELVAELQPYIRREDIQRLYPSALSRRY